METGENQWKLIHFFHLSRTMTFKLIHFVAHTNPRIFHNLILWIFIPLLLNVLQRKALYWAAEIDGGCNQATFITLEWGAEKSSPGLLSTTKKHNSGAIAFSQFPWVLWYFTKLCQKFNFICIHSVPQWCNHRSGIKNQATLLEDA